MQSAAARVGRLAFDAAGQCAASHGGRQPAVARGRRHTHVHITAIATPWTRRAPSSHPPAPKPTPWVPSHAPPAAPLQPPADARPAVLQPGLLTQLWHRYLHSLAKQPLLTKAATSFFCVCVGDGIAQALGGLPFNAIRILRLATYSATVGAATGHYWHRWLEGAVCPDNPTSNRAVCSKMLLDQLLLTPVMTAVFFAALKVMEGRPDAIIPFMQDKYFATLLAGYAIWVPWNYASFKWIPQDLRILAGNLVGIAWGTYVSVSCINSAATPASSATCETVMAAVEAVPAACPTVMAAEQAASLGPQ